MNKVSIELTQGNINNNHIYLSSVMSFFPSSSIGGENKDSIASTHLEICYGASEPVVTDIAGDKKIFRKRTWVKSFIEEHNLQAGDSIVIHKLATNRYHIYPKTL